MAEPAPGDDVTSSKPSMGPASTVLPNSTNRASTSFLQSSWFQHWVKSSADPSSFTPKLLISPNGTCSGGNKHNVMPQKCHDSIENSNRTELDSFTLRIGTSEEEEEEPDRGSNEKIAFGGRLFMFGDRTLPGTIQELPVTRVVNLEEKRDLNLADVKSVDETSTIQSTKVPSFQSREISAQHQNPSLVVEHSGEPFAHVSSVMSRSEQHSLSPLYDERKLVNIPGIDTQKNKTDLTYFVSPGNSSSAFGNAPISMKKPPLPPGAMTRIKEGLSLKSKEFQVQGSPLNSGKQLLRDKVIPGAESDQECTKRGSLYSSYKYADGGRGSVAISGIFDKVPREAINPRLEFQKQVDFHTVYQESILNNEFPQQADFLALSNDTMKKTSRIQGININECEKVSVLEQRRIPLQHSECYMTGKVHLQNFFEEDGKSTREFTVGESLWCNDENDLQVAIKASCQCESGHFFTTSTPTFQGGEPSRSSTMSLSEQAPVNLSKTSNQSFIQSKASKANFVQCDQESCIGDSSASEKSKVNITNQQASFTAVCSPCNMEEMQVQASSASITASLSPEALAKSYNKAQHHLCQLSQGDEMTLVGTDHASWNLVDLNGRVKVGEVESQKSLQHHSKFSAQQLQHNVCKSAEGFGHTFGSRGMDVQVGKVEFAFDADRRQRQADQIMVDCKLVSRHEGVVRGVGIKEVGSSQDKENISLRTESLHPEEVLDSLLSLRPPTTKYQKTQTNFKLSQEHCLDLVPKSRWLKRLRCWHHSDKNMLDSLGSDKVDEALQRKGQICGPGNGPKGNRNPEEVLIHQTAELTEASDGALKRNRINEYGKDVHEQHYVPQRLLNQGKRSRQSDLVACSSVDCTGLAHNSVEQNVAAPMEPSLEKRALQTVADPSVKGNSSGSEQKGSVASVFSQPWIRRWRPSCHIPSFLDEIHCGSAANQGINTTRLKQKHIFATMKKIESVDGGHLYPVKLLPSAAAMAIVGIAARQLRPCRIQKKGSLSVWTAVGFAVN
eukprot:Gb_36516 [translate_table: standard]